MPGLRVGPNGQTTDLIGEAFARVDSLERHLADLTSAIAGMREETEYLRRADSAAVDATLAADLRFGPRPGHIWIVDHLAVTGGAGGAVAVYLDQIDPLALLDYQTVPSMAAWGPEGKLVVPDRSTLILHFYGQGVAGQVVTASIRGHLLLAD